MKKHLLYTLTITLLLFSGCATKYGNQELGNLDDKNLETLIVKNKTTKQDILNHFGGPQDVDVTTNGLDKWKYIYYTQKLDTTAHIPLVNLVKSSSKDERKLLFLIFKDNIVVDYFLSKTKEETRFGISAVLN